MRRLRPISSIGARPLFVSVIHPLHIGLFPVTESLSTTGNATGFCGPEFRAQKKEHSFKCSRVVFASGFRLFLLRSPVLAEQITDPLSSCGLHRVIAVHQSAVTGSFSPTYFRRTLYSTRLLISRACGSSFPSTTSGSIGQHSPIALPESCLLLTPFFTR